MGMCSNKSEHFISPQFIDTIYSHRGMPCGHLRLHSISCCCCNTHFPPLQRFGQGFPSMCLDYDQEKAAKAINKSKGSLPHNILFMVVGVGCSRQAKSGSGVVVWQLQVKY